MPPKKKPQDQTKEDDVELNQEFTKLTMQESLKCCLANVRSVNSEGRWEKKKILMEKFDIVFITESWLDENVGNRMDLLEDKYELFRSDRLSTWMAALARLERRKESRGGGVLCLAKEGIFKVMNLKEITVDNQIIDDTNYEEHFCEILVLCHQKSNTRFILFYKPTETDVAESDLFLQQVIERLDDGGINAILGDLNYPFTPEKWEEKYNDKPWGENPNDEDYLSYFFKNSVKQLVRFKTFKVGNNTLDVIIAPDGIIGNIRKKAKTFFTNSDHNAITFEFKYNPIEIKAGSVIDSSIKQQ